MPNPSSKPMSNRYVPMSFTRLVRKSTPRHAAWPWIFGALLPAVAVACVAVFLHWHLTVALWCMPALLFCIVPMADALAGHDKAPSDEAVDERFGR